MNVLFYIEPHPIRNSFTEFSHIGRTFFPILRRFNKAGYINLTVFSNNQVLDGICEIHSDADSYISRPTLLETEFIDGQFQQWGDAAIEQWLDLVAGQGTVANTYNSILERLHQSFDIDLIFIWSENGAVRNFGNENGIPVVYGELGPTRAPFLGTMYFDTSGTNGNAAFRYTAKALLKDSDLPRQPSCRSWLVYSDQTMGEEAVSTRSIVDITSTYDPCYQELLPKSKYVYIPLQLADDLNTLQHSDFRSPEVFLKYMLPIIADAGYTAVIKGHPGVKNRPYNLRKQVDALIYAESSGVDIRILSNAATQAASLYALGNASFTASINSSVSFESMLLGIPALALGTAAYDAAGWMQQEIQLTSAHERTDYSEKLNALTGVHMQRIFTPADVVQNTDYLWDVFAGAVAAAKGKEATASLRRDIDFTDYVLSNGSVDPGFRPEYIVQTPLDSKRPSCGDVITLKTDQVLFTSQDTPWEILTLNRTDDFVGYIDRCSLDINQQTLGGWALDKASLLPPVLIIIVYGDKVHSTHHMNQSRPDVQKAVFPEMTKLICGFSITIPNNSISNLSAILVDSKNNCHVIENIRNPLNIAQPAAISRIRNSNSIYSKFLANKFTRKTQKMT